MALKSWSRIEKCPDKLAKCSRKKYSSIEKGCVQGCVHRLIGDDKGWSKYQFCWGGNQPALQCLVIYVQQFKCCAVENPKVLGHSSAN